MMEHKYMYKNLVVYFFSFSQKTDVDTDDEMEQPDDRSKRDENRRGSKRQVSIVLNRIKLNFVYISCLSNKFPFFL